MRVNARFESQAEQQIEYIAKHKGMGLSEVLRLGVDRLYQSIRSEQQHSLRHLGAWIGKGDSGRSDVSVNVKAQLQDALEEKYGIEAPRKMRSPAKATPGKARPGPAGPAAGLRVAAGKLSKRGAA